MTQLLRVLPVACALLLSVSGCDVFDSPNAEFRPSDEPSRLVEEEHPLRRAQNVPGGRGSVVSSAGEAEPVYGAGGGGGSRTGDPRLARAQFAEAVRERPIHPDDIQQATAALVGTDSRDIGDGNACEQAYTAFSSFTNEYERQPGAGRGRPTSRERFMEACRAMPETLQRCWVPDYALAHKDECDEARGTPGGTGRRFADRTNERQANPGSARGISGEEVDQSAANAEQRARERRERDSNR